ncbi:hypothetical protein [Paenibacillus amylolyticus]|nr:hypothetical protein [Paenibacillus amylolyticus]
MANGVYKGGTGTANDPYLIEDGYDLFEFLSKVSTINTSKCAQLVNDIDLNIAPYNTGLGFYLGHTTAFLGTFDGDGYVISNYFNRQATNYGGLFPQVGATAVVKNFGMVNVDIQTTGVAYMAAVAGSMTVAGGVIENVYVSGGKFYVGGYSGLILGSMSNGTIRNVYSLNVDIKQYSNYVGGIVGSISSANPQCYSSWASNTTSYNSNNSYLGGFAGGWTNSVPMNIINCYYSTRMNYAGYNGNLALAVTETQLKDPSYMYNLNANQTTSVNTFWVLRPVSYPALWFEDFMSFLLLDAGKPITNLDFGAVLEGSNSPTKKVRLKNGYKYQIKSINVGWARAAGVSDKTELQFSLDGTFTDNVNPLSLNGLSILRGREFDLYARVKTYDGVTGAGQFDITVTVTSAE